MKTLILAAISLAIHAGPCNAGEPAKSPDPINAADVALLLGIHKFQVKVPDEMIGGPVFVKVFYVQPDNAEVELGGCGTGESGAFFDVLLREPVGGDKFAVITRCAGGFSKSEKPVKDIGDPQQWFSDKVATSGDVLGVYWNKAKIVVRIRPTANPVWNDDGDKPRQQKAKPNLVAPETARTSQ